MPVLTLPDAVARREWLRAHGRSLVLTNGVFDLLHVGHVDYLEKARALGDALFVGINGDRAARQLKGEGRPLVPALDRARLVGSLACVDAALVFDDLTAEKLIRALCPEIYAKGGDYGPAPPAKHLPEAAAVQEAGGRVVLIELLPGRSTTGLIESIVRGLSAPSD